ncbi:fructose bisphosphate aldolase [Sphingomonas sp. R86521]|uniref:fructose bisphosphate aldolase n=1 Tax=Sphingomonas sp. R86521 TaxID=3093860 RepID=UPI0036D23B62
MSYEEMATRMSQKAGFIAALDQSGGSTPGALRAYGVPDDAYTSDAEMSALIHDFRVRVMTAPSFTSDKVIAAILFEATMDGTIGETPVPTLLWAERRIVPFLKVDKGLEGETDGVSLMKPVPGLETVLGRAVKLRIFGTKMRSTIRLPSPSGISSIVTQQFQFAERIAEFGLMPIIEPEILIGSPDKSGAEAILLDELLASLDALPSERSVMLKLTIPDVSDHYAPLAAHPRVTRVVALSGGYSRDEACRRLSTDHGMIASFSRALIGDLRHDMDDATFDAVLKTAIDQIYLASTKKT